MIKFLVFLCVISSDLAMSFSYPIIKGKHGERYHTGLITRQNKGLGETHVTLADCDNLPDEFDLRTIGTVPPIRDQGSCGSCTMFAKIGALISSVLANGGTFAQLSEQERVSCDKKNYGCQGGDFNGASEYDVVHGVGLDSDFPYTSGRTGSNGVCKQIPVKVKATQWVAVGQAGRSPTEKEVMCALYKTHALAALTVSAGSDFNDFPSTEDKIHTSCGNRNTNHMVGVVGWKMFNGKRGFIMKNSWSESWGAKGYGILPLGCDNFGEDVQYVMTDVMPCKPPVFKLPAEVDISSNVEVMLGVKEQANVSYEWFEADKSIGTGNMIYVMPSVDTVYKLVGKSACGQVESSVKVKILSM